MYRLSSDARYRLGNVGLDRTRSCPSGVMSMSTATVPGTKLSTRRHSRSATSCMTMSLASACSTSFCRIRILRCWLSLVTFFITPMKKTRPLSVTTFDRDSSPQIYSPSLRVNSTSRDVPTIRFWLLERLRSTNASCPLRCSMGTSTFTFWPSTSFLSRPHRFSAALLKKMTWFWSSIITVASMACSSAEIRTSALRLGLDIELPRKRDKDDLQPRAMRTVGHAVWDR
ncbi:hypothetical protein GLUCOINTEAF2_0202180 [Komagataeibacter intermedius AF2]|uniref:Uncharacterized protein n=1 Tax=Komagataeibacter intermedius AF2 TaxID=1458464 RepID=A0A0N0MFA8_9PROT|nr:hypothetical protein GLUCOINTEAF2_0202180 [Komagataeibacter intermedius AF2]